MDKSFQKPGQVSNIPFYFIHNLEAFSQARLIM